MLFSNHALSLTFENRSKSREVVRVCSDARVQLLVSPVKSNQDLKYSLLMSAVLDSPSLAALFKRL